MTQELIYTSAPQGLKRGSRGFCTVACTQGMPSNLAELLESLSGYRHAFPIHSPQAKNNPVNYSHLIVTLGGQQYHVLSRVADAGEDYTGRSNKLAHHVVLTPAELPPGGPAWVLADPGFCLSRWDGQVRMIPQGRKPRTDVPAVGPCRNWQAATGDAGWGGVLAQAALQGRSPLVVIFPPGTDTLPLVLEALNLIPESKRWEVTFSTYFTRLPPGIGCQWRFVLDGTAEADQARRDPRVEKIDLCASLGEAPSSPMVDAARTGRVVQLEASPPRSVAASPAKPPVAAPPPLPGARPGPVPPVPGSSLPPAEPSEPAPQPSAPARRSWGLVPILALSLAGVFLLTSVVLGAWLFQARRRVSQLEQEVAQLKKQAERPPRPSPAARPRPKGNRPPQEHTPTKPPLPPPNPGPDLEGVPQDPGNDLTPPPAEVLPGKSPADPPPVPPAKGEAKKAPKRKDRSPQGAKRQPSPAKPRLSPLARLQQMARLPRQLDVAVPLVLPQLQTASPGKDPPWEPVRVFQFDKPLPPGEEKKYPAAVLRLGPHDHLELELLRTKALVRPGKDQPSPLPMQLEQVPGPESSQRQNRWIVGVASGVPGIIPVAEFRLNASGQLQFRWRVASTVVGARWLSWHVLRLHVGGEHLDCALLAPQAVKPLRLSGNKNKRNVPDRRIRPNAGGIERALPWKEIRHALRWKLFLPGPQPPPKERLLKWGVGDKLEPSHNKGWDSLDFTSQERGVLRNKQSLHLYLLRKIPGQGDPPAGNVFIRAGITLSATNDARTGPGLVLGAQAFFWPFSVSGPQSLAPDAHLVVRPGKEVPFSAGELDNLLETLRGLRTEVDELKPPKENKNPKALQQKKKRMLRRLDQWIRSLEECRRTMLRNNEPVLLHYMLFVPAAETEKSPAPVKPICVFYTQVPPAKGQKRP